MKKIFFVCLCFASIALYSQNTKFYLKSSIGYIGGKETFKGVATDIGVGYVPLRYAGIEIATDNWYRYADNSNSDTNTGLSLLLHLYPLTYKGNTIDLTVGYGLNLNYWTRVYTSESNQRASSVGRHIYKSPVLGAAYYYSFHSFDLGFVYKRQSFNGYISNENQQYLLSIKKHF